jgi:hypothetical protein
MRKPVTTRDRRTFDRLWSTLGGVIEFKHGTGELLYVNAMFGIAVRINGRRKDVPAVLISKINQILRSVAANDAAWELSR